MIATKRKRAAQNIGRKRGVPMRLITAIARRYDLDKIVVWTADKADRRPRELILTWGRSNSVAVQASTFANAVAKAAGWSKENCEIEVAFVRRLKGRIKELETALAQIVDGCPDPVALARAAGQFPNESDEENLGEWIFYPQGMTSRESRLAQCAAHNALSSEQLAADKLRDFAFATARKISAQNFANLAGEIETAIKHSMTRFKGWRWNGSETP
jgi:hypothetical protein